MTDAGRESLSKIQTRGLIELCAACDESLRLRPTAGGWTRTWLLSGTKEERSSANILSLVATGMAEGRKPDGGRQTQWIWRITALGRATLGKRE